MWHAVRVLAVGTWLVARWAWGRLWAAGQADDDLVGPVVVVVVGVVMVGVAVAATPILASPLTLVWLVAAGVSGHRHLGAEPPPGPDAEDVEAVEGTGPRTAEAPTDDELLRALADLIGTRNGVLLRDVVAAFHKAGVRTSWGIPELRAQCERLRIPIKASLQVGKFTSKGVHREGLKAVIYPVLANAEKAPPYWPADLPRREEPSCD